MPNLDESKRIAIFTTNILPISETFIREQVSELHKWEPVLLGLCEVQDGLATPGITREIVHIASNRMAVLLRLWLPWPIKVLTERFKSVRASLVHAHFALGATEIWPSVKAANLPMLVTLHGFDIHTRRDWWEDGHGGFHRRSYPRRLLRMACEPTVHFIAVSEDIKRRAIEFGISANKITVLYIGVNTRLFTPGPTPIRNRPKRILFTGRMVEKKAPLLMLRAFAEIQARIPDAELVMIGAGPLLGTAKRLAAELFLRVTFLGACSSAEVLEQLNQSRVFCLPSITASNGDAEGFGLVLLEAQACGVPVVTSARGGAMEGLLAGETGYPFLEGDQTGLVRSLYSILSDENKNVQMSMAAVSYIRKHFDISACTDALEKFYEHFLQMTAPDFAHRSQT